jgi:subtilisin family serine protease
MKRTRAFLLWLSLGSLLGLLFAPPASGQIGRIISDQYIVVFRDDVADPEGTADSLTRPFGLTRQHLFRRALKGFSAVISPTRLAAIQRDPRVRYVVPDQEVEAFDQTIPPGITRIGTDLNPVAAINGLDERVDIGIAIIDTGINFNHPDLNVAGGVCITGTYYNFGSSCSSPEDQHGHGTHVAGTAAALDNGIGVVGVAPGARLYAVKVLDRQGSGSTSQVIAGIDWVTLNAPALGIRVANMSLGGSGADDGNCGLTNNDPMHTAICRSVAAGVTYVVAAGNSSADARTAVPAAYDEVITVSAMVDTNGQDGGLGPSTSYGADDSFASFSNFGPDVDLTAPGVNIYSTYLSGGYTTMSGTSMAAPHVTGAVALYLAQNPSASPAQVRQALINQGLPGPWPGDRDGLPEPLVYVGAVHDVAVTTISAPAWVLTGNEVSIAVTVTNTGTFQETAATLALTDQTGTVLVGSIDIGSLDPGAAFTTSFSWTATPAGPHTILAQVNLDGDSNAANNSKSVTIQVKDPLHDVEVTGLTAPATAITGQTVSIKATVTNLGTYDESFNVTLTDNSTPVEAKTAVVLSAGMSATLTFTWTPPSQGSRLLEVTTSLAEDANPSNNTQTKTVAVSDVPLLVATVATDKPSYTSWQTVKITTTVKNNAGSLVSGASVGVVIKGPNGRTSSKTGTTSSAGTFVLSWRGYYGPGTYPVKATATKSGYQSGSGQTSFQVQ